MIIDANDLYKPRVIAVENNSYQQTLVQGLKEMSLVPVVGFHSMSKGKQNPKMGVPAMDIFFETGRFRIPRGNTDSVRKTDQLIEELHYWERSETSDLAMALWFAFERMKSHIEISTVLKKPKDVIFGDRLRYERQKVLGLAGQPIPRMALQIIRQKANNQPLGS